MEIRPDLSLCLIPHAAGADLGPCLSTLFACTDPLSLEVFVPQGAACGEFGKSSHLHFLAQENGPAWSLIQEAWARARGRYAGLWHSEVMAAPGSLFNLVEFLDDHPDVAIAGPRFFNEQGDILPTAFQGRLLADRLMPGWDGLSTMEVDWLSGAALVLNSLALSDIALPEGELGGLWERSLCQRLQDQGWHHFFVHLARVISPRAFCVPISAWARLRSSWLFKKINEVAIR